MVASQCLERHMGNIGYIYYGAVDKLIAARSVDLAELLTKLKRSP